MKPIRHLPARLLVLTAVAYSCLASVTLSQDATGAAPVPPAASAPPPPSTYVPIYNNSAADAAAGAAAAQDDSAVLRAKQAADASASLDSAMQGAITPNQSGSLSAGSGTMGSSSGSGLGGAMDSTVTGGGAVVQAAGTGDRQSLELTDDRPHVALSSISTVLDGPDTAAVISTTSYADRGMQTSLMLGRIDASMRLIDETRAVSPQTDAAYSRLVARAKSINKRIDETDKVREKAWPEARVKLAADFQAYVQAVADIEAVAYQRQARN